jgi:hypothetical protein
MNNLAHCPSPKKECFLCGRESKARLAATNSACRRCHWSEAHQENDWPTTRASETFADHNRVSADEDYEVEYFARENGVTIEQVRELIKANGNDRSALIEAARALRVRYRTNNEGKDHDRSDQARGGALRALAYMPAGF